MKEPGRVNILGVGVSAINMSMTLEIVDGWIERQDPHYICLTAIHSVMECYRNPELRRIFNTSGLTTPDGMPMVWLCRWKGFQQVERVYAVDLVLELCEHSIKHGYRHFFYGGRDWTSEGMAERLRERFPGLAVVGTCSRAFGPLTAEENAEVTRMVQSSRPDIVWVGLGTKRQELWMADNLHKLQVPVMIGVGAAFDFISGRKRQAPYWMQRGGLEWFFRLTQEPGRLWRRYLADNPLFVALLLTQALGLCHYPMNA